MKRTKTVVTIPHPMDEVIDLENRIRAALKTKKKWSAALVADAEAIMAGKPTKVPGTRLERLRVITAKMGLI
jgi:hypothetical protein